MEEYRMKIGFIGTGNMAGAIIRGIISSGHTKASDIYCTNTHPDKLEIFAKDTGVNACASNDDLVAASDVVVLSVKPHIIDTVLLELQAAILKKNPLIVSIAAAITLENIQNYINPAAKTSIIRVMPNVNAAVGAGITAVCPNEFATTEQTTFVLSMFEAVGTTIKLAEKDFACFGAVGSASPAFSYMFIDSLARGGVKNGLSKAVATKIAAQAVLGSAKMILESNEAPWALVDKVCSPGGTTIAGVLALEDNAFVATVMKSIDAAVQRDKELME